MVTVLECVQSRSAIATRNSTFYSTSVGYMLARMLPRPSLLKIARGVHALHDEAIGCASHVTWLSLGWLIAAVFLLIHTKQACFATALGTT